MSFDSAGNETTSSWRLFVKEGTTGDRQRFSAIATVKSKEGHGLSWNRGSVAFLNLFYSIVRMMEQTISITDL